MKNFNFNKQFNILLIFYFKRLILSKQIIHIMLEIKIPSMLVLFLLSTAVAVIWNSLNFTELQGKNCRRS